MRTASNPEYGPAFDAWFDDFLADYLRRHPVNATFLGARQFDQVLPDFSREADAEQIARARDLIARLDAIPNDGLTEAQIYDRALARGFLELEIWETGSPFFQAGNPSHHTGEAVFSVNSLFQRESAPLADRVEAAIQRMRALPEFLETARRRVSMAPLMWTERAIREAEAGVAYFGNGLRVIAEDRGIERPEFLAQAEAAAQAFHEHARWLRGELAERRISFQPAGDEAYDRYLHRGHFLPADQNGSWWFDYAHAELIETTQELRELARSIDWKRSWKQQLAELPEHHPSTERYYETFERVWEICRRQAIDAELITWPGDPIAFVPIPRFDRDAASGLVFPLFRGAPVFGDHRASVYLLPPCDPSMSAGEQERVLRGNNDTRIHLDHVIRNAGLGRFVQHTRALEAESRIGQIAGTACAARSAMFCGGTLVTGWAGYAVELMEESGTLTELERLAEALARVRIAARAVADTAIHSGEFTVERAARFYRDEAGMPTTAALDAAVANAMFPGQGVAELAGVVMIDELRRQIGDREGAAFSPRSFHDRFLSYGAIPVTLIAASMLRANSPEAISPASPPCAST